jgi:WD40 repeat protein
MVGTLFAKETLTPNKIFQSSGTVQDIVYNDGKLYAGTSNGTVEIFDTQTTEKIEQIKVPDIIDFMGDSIPAKIYSIDLYEDMVLIVSQGMKGYRNIFLYKDQKLTKIIDIEKKYFIQKASFVSGSKIFFGLLSNQVGLYDFENKKLEYLIQLSASSFSHFVLDEQKKTLATTDESGIVRVLDISTANIIRQPKPLNKDRVYQLDYKQGVILAAGQDRKAVVYTPTNSFEFEYDFLLYSCGLSPKAKKAGIAFNEKNEVMVVDLASQKEIAVLTGQRATLTQIRFINEFEIFVSSDDSQINYFKIN